MYTAQRLVKAQYNSKITTVFFGGKRTDTIHFLGQLQICFLTLSSPMSSVSVSSYVQRHSPTYIFNFWHSGTLTLSPGRQSARMSEIKNGRFGGLATCEIVTAWGGGGIRSRRNRRHLVLQTDSENWQGATPRLLLKGQPGGQKITRRFNIHKFRQFSCLRCSPRPPKHQLESIFTRCVYSFLCHASVVIRSYRSSCHVWVLANDHPRWKLVLGWLGPQPKLSSVGCGLGSIGYTRCVRRS